jgi:hypothetical protein
LHFDLSIFLNNSLLGKAVLIKVLKSGPTGRPGTGTGLNKKHGKEKPGMACLTWRPGQKPGCNPLTLVFLFLLKRRRFDFLQKKLTRITW